MFEPPESPYRVPFKGEFRVADAPTEPPESADADKQGLRDELDDLVAKLSDYQRILYAHDRHALLLVFQAMDAAGKDGTIRAVTSGVNPAGCQVFSFKQPSSQELDHDFLWRTAQCLPERGRIGIFNRSYYEEVLVVRVHPEYLQHQRLPPDCDLKSIWDERFESIRDHEKHLARNGTVVLKFWLNVSKDEQRKRFLKRIDVKEKNWKFSTGDIEERGHWTDYMHAYDEMLNATSRAWAPWYAIPADNKPYMRVRVAQIVVDALSGLGLHYPKLGKKERAELEEMRKLLQ